MASLDNPREVAAEMRRVRQVRQFESDPVPDDVLTELLEIARWTGSSRNSQPWYFIVVTDKDQIRALSQLRDRINWVAGAPLVIALVFNGEGEISEAYDEGRVTERLMIGARILGLGSGVAWFGDAGQQQQAKEILGIPADRTAESMVAFGYSQTAKDPRPGPVHSGRKPLREIVSYGRFNDDV